MATNLSDLDTEQKEYFVKNEVFVKEEVDTHKELENNHYHHLQDSNIKQESNKDSACVDDPLYELEDHCDNGDGNTPHPLNEDTIADTPRRDEYSIHNDTDFGDSTQHSVYCEAIKGNSNPKLSMQKTSSKKQLYEVTAAMKELEAIANPKGVDDECEIFGKHVAVQLKILHPEHCILAQEDIQRVLTKYRLAALSSNSSCHTQPPNSLFSAHSSYSVNADSTAIPSASLSSFSESHSHSTVCPDMYPNTENS